MLFWLLTLSATCLFYGAMLAAYAVGFRRTLAASAPEEIPIPDGRPTVSVVVAARNEEHHIGACLTSILDNDYPAEQLEVVVVDDRSTDQTAAIVARMQQEVAASRPPVDPQAPRQPAIRLIRLTEAENGSRAYKKRAIQRGIEASSGEIILTTDADCEVSRSWIRTMAERFSSDTAFVSGPVLYRAGTTVFSQVQALEFLGLVALGAGAIGIGRPAICNGANVGYRRSVFNEVGGFEGIDHLTSGDDELLMQKIATTTTHGIRFSARRSAVVWTDPMPSVRSFFSQRKRWASKGLYYPRKSLVLALVAIYGYYLSLLVGFVTLWFVPAVRAPLLLALAVKIVAEASILVPAASFFRMKRLLWYLIPAQPFQILYIVLAPPAGILLGYQWKDRDIQR